MTSPTGFLQSAFEAFFFLVLNALMLKEDGSSSAEKLAGTCSLVTVSCISLTYVKLG